MSSKVVLEKRRPDTVILECRVRRRDASEKRGLAGLRQSPWGERASGTGGLTRAARSSWFSSGQDLRCDSPSSGTTRSHHRCDQPAVRDGNGLHLAWGANSCDLYCSAGGRNWPVTSITAVQHHTRFWGNSGHAGAIMPHTAGHFPPRAGARGLTVEAPHAARSEPTDAPGSRAAFPSPRARTHPGPPAAAQRTGEARAHPLQPLGLLPEAHPYFGKSLLRPLGQRDHRRLRPPSTAPHRHMHDEP
jgi:hypothetical protein